MGQLVGAILALASLVGLASGAQGAETTFDARAVEPYFSSGVAGAASESLRLGDASRAAEGLRAYVAGLPKAAPGSKHAAAEQRARFLLAYAELKAGQPLAAARRFDALLERYPLLADYHLLWGARGYLAAGMVAEAAARASKVSAGSVLDGEARLVRAEAAIKLGHGDEAASEYRGYLTAYPSSWRAQEARYRLGEALELGGKVDEARAELRRVYVESPGDSWGKLAGDKLLSQGGAPVLDAEERARRAAALFEAMRNKESEEEWALVLKLPNLSDALACTARFHVAQSVFKQRDRQRAAPLFEAAAAICLKARDEDLTTKALYQAGRSFGTRGEKDPPGTRHAVALFERVWREHPKHSYADDAQVREAEALDALKQPAEAAALLAGLPEVFREGDQKGEALWRLAFRAWRKGDLVEATRWLKSELELLPREEGWWEAGRTLYWLGRASERRGDPADATGWYQRAFKEYPLSYYALQAGNRLRELKPAIALALFSASAEDPGDPEGWSFAARPLFSSPSFLRGIELLRLGLGPEARRELAVSGLQPAKRGMTVKGPEDEELQWLAAVLYDHAGEYASSHALPRHVLRDYERTFPVAKNRKRWLISYPRGYAELIEKHAPQNGQPTALQFAIVREESAFDPLQESFANAVGLTQLTAAPAQRFANGLPHDRAALRDPAINVAIGARELGSLWALFGANAALAIAGYNAGEGAVKRWLAEPERAGMVLDEFVEAIPYDETRGYTKRVLASYFAYRWLEGGPPGDRVPLLRLPIAAPKRR